MATTHPRFYIRVLDANDCVILRWCMATELTGYSNRHLVFLAESIRNRQDKRGPCRDSEFLTLGHAGSVCRERPCPEDRLGICPESENSEVWLCLAFERVSNAIRATPSSRTLAPFLVLYFIKMLTCILS